MKKIAITCLLTMVLPAMAMAALSIKTRGSTAVAATTTVDSPATVDQTINGVPYTCTKK